MSGSAESQILGAMLGLACGDALGAPAEFLSKDTLRQRYGRLTEMVGNDIWSPGEWTDDTAMTLCMAEGILAHPDDPVMEVGQRFLAWRESKPKDMGSTISEALGRYVIRTALPFEGNMWPEVSQSTTQARDGRAGGNGSLMRTLPVALAYTDTAVMLRQSARLSAMTHWDPQAEVGCAVYCLWVRNLLNGEERLPAWINAVSAAKTEARRGNIAPGETPGPSPLPASFWERLDAVADLPESRLQPSGYAGYVLECLEAAVWWVLKADSLEEALVGCVNLAGEADTIAAVAGGAAGAYWGQEGIPARWLTTLLERQRIEEVGHSLLRLRQG
jgi:ADP-ribosyl-[dinitrogen reductase] hydrolase